MLQASTADYPQFYNQNPFTIYPHGTAISVTSTATLLQAQISGYQFPPITTVTSTSLCAGNQQKNQNCLLPLLVFISCWPVCFNSHYVAKLLPSPTIQPLHLVSATTRESPSPSPRLCDDAHPAICIPTFTSDALMSTSYPSSKINKPPIMYHRA